MAAQHDRLRTRAAPIPYPQEAVRTAGREALTIGRERHYRINTAPTAAQHDRFGILPAQILDLHRIVRTA
jgi:hypothetical protein